MIDQLVSIDWPEVLFHLAQLSIAYLLVLPLGLDREQSEQHFGLRTFPLVAMVTCGFMLVGISVLSSTGAEARAFQGIVTGIGFLGGGAILKNDDKVQGTATAASIWNCGAIGIAVAFSRLEITIVLAVINFVTLRWVRKVKSKVDDVREGKD